MTVFGDYAKFYDVLYSEKDYSAEVDFLVDMFNTYAQQPIHSVLDLGCGTGGHALPLALRGYQVTGVDLSEEMLQEARDKGNKLPGEITRPSFHKGDLRRTNLEKKFDAVISMFAVMSYMTTNEDLLAAFQTARTHLKPGGLFYFDAWFGPAVLTERPSDRYKITDTDDGQIIRFVHPVLSMEKQTVEVNYRILEIQGNTIINKIEETHTMRFFFPQEIIYYLNSVGLEMVSMFPFLKLGQPLSEKEWNFAVVAKLVTA